MELIDKKAAYEALKREAEMHELPFTREAYESAARIIDKMNAYRIVLPVRLGQWIRSHEVWACSECGGKAIWQEYGQELSDFCPHCGAKMDGDEE